MSTTTAAENVSIERRPAHRLLEAVDSLAPGLKPAAQRLLVRLGYAFVNRWLDEVQASCMNYGYAAEGERAPAGEAYGFALYAHVVGGAELEGRDVLEVGCGRGGGAAFVAQRFAPRMLTGLDFSERAIAFARARDRDPRLRFVVGDAERLPFADRSFDALINVESSHCYPSVPRFVGEAFRVLRPGGRLLFADLRLAGDVEEMRRTFAQAGFEIAEEERITENVALALELDTPRRTEFVRERVPRPLRPYMLNFAGARGSDVHRALRDGGLEYLRLMLVRPG